VVERGNTCIDDKFAAFLTDGSLPNEFATCPRLPEPVPPGAAAARNSGVANPADFQPVIGRP
jgi:hypothetical protein